MPAVAQDRDAIGDFERFFQRVTDEDSRYSILPQPHDQREKMTFFLRRQGSSGLVENDHLRLEAHRARDLHHLPFRSPERLDRRSWIDRKVQRLKELLGVDIGSAQTVEKFFVAKVKILRDRHTRDEAGLLIYHRNAVAPGERRAGDLDSPALDSDFALGRRHRASEDLDERRLACPVLADDRVNFAAPQVEMDVFKRGNAAIVLADAYHFQDGRLCLGSGSHGGATVSANEATTPSPLAAK
jgi:hypothetical protein